jgi:uncharacterized repeat protein (TIGR01451 family)
MALGLSGQSSIRQHEPSDTKETTMKRTITLVTLLLCTTLLLPALVLAKPLITISITTSKEVTETVNGTKTKKLVPTKLAATGDTLVYNLVYSNKGNETATDAIVDNPISAGMTYIDNSAGGVGAEITFSIDGGKSYKKPSLLTYEIRQPNGSVQKYTARPEEYTHIRWTIKQVPAGTGGTLGFSARVK